MRKSRSEKRKRRRLNVNFTLYYRIHKPIDVRMMVGNQEVNALMIDLSEGGMAIKTDFLIPVSTILLTKFTLIDDTLDKNERVKPMDITGEVKYSVPTDSKENRLGIYFLKISREDRMAIASYVWRALSK
jgi:c-di-GMP-binding flagellar brake protein YcgR